jgi:hypothetical protein
MKSPLLEAGAQQPQPAAKQSMKVAEARSDFQNEGFAAAREGCIGHYTSNIKDYLKYLKSEMKTDGQWQILTDNISIIVLLHKKTKLMYGITVL